MPLTRCQQQNILSYHRHSKLSSWVELFSDCIPATANRVRTYIVGLKSRRQKGSLTSYTNFCRQTQTVAVRHKLLLSDTNCCRQTQISTGARVGVFNLLHKRPQQQRQTTAGPTSGTTTQQVAYRSVNRSSSIGFASHIHVVPRLDAVDCNHILHHQCCHFNCQS